MAEKKLKMGSNQNNMVGIFMSADTDIVTLSCASLALFWSRF